MFTVKFSETVEKQSQLSCFHLTVDPKGCESSRKISFAEANISTKIRLT